ncbi:MAG TPA: zinc-binding dehydrogenase, partial [Mycobacteriales bacterium]|nr:zinc-binding dehydrogenase [Mycobacteriales bacterium]
MQALAITERGAAADVIEVPDPSAGGGEVRVAVEAASVNGFDLAVAAGHIWESMPAEFPVVLGRDFAGRVESLGAGVDRLAVGDLVTGAIHGAALGPGSIAEYVVQDAATLARVPDGVSAEQSAALGLAACAAFDVVESLAVVADDVVLVSGATGGVGTYIVQLARARGARVVATARPGEEADVVTRLGATDVVDYTGDVAAQLRTIAPDGATKVAHAAGDPVALAALATAGGRFASLRGVTAESLGRDDLTAIPVVARVTTDKL